MFNAFIKLDSCIWWNKKQILDPFFRFSDYVPNCAVKIWQGLKVKGLQTRLKVEPVTPLPLSLYGANLSDGDDESIWLLDI